VRFARYFTLCASRLRLFFCVLTPSDSQKHEFRVLNELFELLSPHGSNSTIHNSVIRAERHIHHRRHLELIISSRGILIHNYSLLGSAHSKDACLGRVDDS